MTKLLIIVKKYKIRKIYSNGKFILSTYSLYATMYYYYLL